MLRLQTAIDVIGMQYLSGFGIHRQDLPRPDTTLGDHVFRLVIPDTHFGSQSDVAVRRRNPARRAQTIAVEQADRVAAIGEHYARRTVPRLHVHGVEFIEGAQIGIHRLDVLPGRRNDHAQATEQIHTAGDQQLQHVVHA